MHVRHAVCGEFYPHMSYFALKVCGYCSAFFICLASFVCLHDIFFYARWYYEKSLPSYGITVAFAFCMLFVSFAAMVYGAWRALKIPAFVYNDLYVKELPEELEGMRIVHLSDLHIGSILMVNGLENWLTELMPSRLI